MIYSFRKGIILPQSLVEKRVDFNPLQLKESVITRIVLQLENKQKASFIIKKNQRKIDIFLNSPIEINIPFLPNFNLLEKVNQLQNNLNNPTNGYEIKRGYSINQTYDLLIPKEHSCILSTLSLCPDGTEVVLEVSKWTSSQLDNFRGSLVDKLKSTALGISFTLKVSTASQNNSKEIASFILSRLYSGESCGMFNTYESPLGNIMLSQEIAPLIPLPVSIESSIPFIEMIRYPVFEPVWVLNENNDGNIKLGSPVQLNTSASYLSIPLSELNRHVLICGMTGSGKTTTCVNILKQVNKPFLVIEPIAKKEYRKLLSEKSPVVFTIGDDEKPFMMNPFTILPNITCERHINLLVTCFTTAYQLWDPLPLILERALQDLYKRYGWDLTKKYKKGEMPVTPSLFELRKILPQVIDKLGYSQKSEFVFNAKAALELRIGNLLNGQVGRVLNVIGDLDWNELLKQNVVFELGMLSSQEHKNLFMALLLSTIIEYCEANGIKNELQHILVLEEAHRIISNTSFSSQENNYKNSSKYTNEVFSNALAELRGFGEGIIIIEQSPTKILLDVIKNTNLKIMHYLPFSQDREVMGYAMNMNPTQFKEAGYLTPGQAIVYYDKIPSGQPTCVKIINNISISSQSTTNQDVKVMGNIHKVVYPFCELCRCLDVPLLEQCPIVELKEGELIGNEKLIKEELEEQGKKESDETKKKVIARKLCCVLAHPKFKEG